MKNENIGEIKRFFSEYRKPLTLGTVQWMVTTMLQVDRLFFSYEHESRIFFLVKGLYLLLLLAAWCFGAYLLKLKRTNGGDPEFQRGAEIFKVYFSILMVLLLLLWPGTWSWDDLFTLDAIHDYHSLYPWQHILTGLYQDLLLQILPFPGGIIFLQNAIAALCVAFSVTKLEKIFSIGRLKIKLLDIFLKVLPFLLPPVLLYQFSGYRIGVYLYLELVLLVLLLCACREKKSWRWSGVLLFSFLTVIVCTWRTESVIYIPCVAVVFLLLKESTISRLKRVVSLALILAGVMGINQWQSWEQGTGDYQVVAIIRPCTELIRAADPVEDAEELASIDKVMDLQIVYENPTLDGEMLYWGTQCVRTRNDDPTDDYTDQDFGDYIKAFLKLSVKYPGVVLKERVNLFLQSAGVKGQMTTNVSAAAILFQDDTDNLAAQNTLSKGWFADTPVFKDLRTKVIYALGCMNGDGTPIVWAMRLVWNGLIPLVFLGVGWFILLLKKKWDIWWIVSVLLGKVVIVFLTQPAPWIMYLLSFYMLGYLLVIFGIGSYFSKKHLEHR